MRSAILIIALLLAGPIQGRERDYGSAVVTQVTSIYDGDTFRGNIAGWPAIIGERIPIRIAGIDAPELRAHCRRELLLARAAKRRTVELLRSAHTIELRHIHRGKWFRLIANVIVDGKDLGRILVEEGLARPYYGGRRRSWCEETY